jgi:peptidyl-prolyl cis-trans isomerase SurA
MTYRIFTVIALVFLTAPLQAQRKKSEAVLFTVGRNPVMTDEFIRLYSKNALNRSAATTKEEVEEYLQLLINFKLKITEAKARGLDTTDRFIKEFKTYREELKKPYRTEPDALDLLTQKTYQRLTEEIKASHILIMVKPDATPADTLAAFQKIMEAKKRIERGENFEKVAAEVSEDPSAKYNFGNLGYFTALQMVYPFEEAAYNTKPGELSPVVRTQFGYHLIKVYHRQPARGEVEVSHILLRSASPDDKTVKDKIFEIYDQLKAGRNWEEVCKEYSEDPGTKDNGGRLRAFGVGALASVPEFEAQAFAMKQPGEISDPFQSNIGWHIIRLEKKIPLPPYSEMEPSLKRRLARDERLQLSRKALSEKKKKEFGFEEVKEWKDKMMALADSSLINGTWNPEAVRAWKDQTLFTLNAHKATVGDFAEFIKQTQSKVMMSPDSYMGQLYDNFVDEMITNAEEEKLKKEQPEFRNLLTEYREGIMLFDIMEKEVWNKASEDTVGLKKYYQQHASRYPGGDRVEARILSAGSRELIEEMINKVNQGDSISNNDLRRFRSIQPFRIFERKDNKVIDKINWSVGLHDVELDNQHYLVQVKRLVPPGVKSFEEARAQVIADYQDHLEKEWLSVLRARYPVKINTKGKKLVLAELTEKKKK